MPSITNRASWTAVLAACLFMAAGCSDSNKRSVFNADTGKHSLTWYTDHRAAFLSGQTDCTECHGSDLLGGISKVSCYSADFNGQTCHASGPVGHPAGWADPTSHGAAAKSAPSGTAVAGFAACQTCHGTDFTGGTASQTCLNTAGCHGTGVAAPHSPKPWRGGARTHTNTDPANAAVCALCHTNGTNSSIHPSPQAPTGTAPDCFNSTLCHGTIGHSTGWSNPDAHGASAKSLPSTTDTTGFSTCQTCHGLDFTGGSANQTCLNTAGCHGATVGAPHSPSPWRLSSSSTSTRTHTLTNTANAPVCGLCHLAGRTPPSYVALPTGTQPGCFDNSLCHGSDVVPHVVPFTDATLHGPVAKTDLTYCEACHATPSNGGPGSNPRFNVPKGNLVAGCESSGCHNAKYAHPTQWRGLTTTAPGGHMAAGNMANACALCHGVDLAGGVGPACSTCHTSSPLTNLSCTSCHSKPPNGTTSPNRAGAHSAHDALPNVTSVCDTCHLGGGTKTANHAYGRTSTYIAFTQAYNAKNRTAARNTDGTCSNVSCHGGQNTPVWISGVIDVNTQCTVCHAYGTTQYNSFNSGEHNLHVNSQGFACTDCHDTTKLATVHFSDLNTSAMTKAYQTILSSRNYTGTGSGTGRCSNFTCHGETHTNYQW